jgi:hypothetical protein
MVNLVGGRLFPGEHHRTTFQVSDHANAIELHAHALDGSLSVDLSGRDADNLPSTSLFSSLEEASEFFRCGSSGYSETRAGNRLDGVRLITHSWEVRPLSVDLAGSSYFADTSLFPHGTIEFDCALIMRNIEHDWQAIPDLYTQEHGSVRTEKAVS